MKEKEAYYEWEGFDSNLHVYNERREKWHQARIWWCLGAISLALSITLIVREFRDYQITRTYQCIRGEYVDGERVSYMAGDVQRFYYLPAHSVRMDGDYVLLFYKEDISSLQTVPTLISWLPHQIFFAALTIVSGWRLWIVYKGRKHSEE